MVSDVCCSRRSNMRTLQKLALATYGTFKRSYSHTAAPDGGRVRGVNGETPPAAQTSKPPCSHSRRGFRPGRSCSHFVGGTIRQTHGSPQWRFEWRFRESSALPTASATDRAQRWSTADPIGPGAMDDRFRRICVIALRSSDGPFPEPTAYLPPRGSSIKTSRFTGEGTAANRRRRRSSLTDERRPAAVGKEPTHAPRRVGSFAWRSASGIRRRRRSNPARRTYRAHPGSCSARNCDR